MVVVEGSGIRVDWTSGVSKVVGLAFDGCEGGGLVVNLWR